MNDCISINHESGLALIQDERVFRAGNQEFCERLTEHLLNDHDVSSVRVTLDDNLCRLEFAPGRLCRAEMAERFANAVRAAASSRPRRLERLLGRRRHGWTSLTGFAGDGHASIWQMASEQPGVLKLRHRGLRGDRRRVGAICASLADDPEIQSCRAHRWSRQVEVRYTADLATPEHIAAAAEAALRRMSDGETEPQQPIRVYGLRRIWYTALGCGSFVLACVGMVVPGVPTVPFVLLTSYYFVRSSPTLHRMLLESRLFGDILRDWEKWGGMRQGAKLKAIGFTVALCAATLLLATPPLAVVALVFAIAGGSIYYIQRLPGVPNEQQQQLQSKSRLAITG
ncbi:MAG TPA: YbaN family protein [Pirellulales bacterium]|nr:YbaN family protein [Pirellulales bacterium]